MDVFRTNAENDFFADIAFVADDLALPSGMIDVDAVRLEVNVAAFFQTARDEVHRRRTDEAGDKHVYRMVVKHFRRAACWMTPSFMTTIRSPIVIASIWSWVT